MLMAYFIGLYFLSLILVNWLQHLLVAKTHNKCYFNENISRGFSVVVRTRVKIHNAIRYITANDRLLKAESSLLGAKEISVSIELKQLAICFIQL